MAGRPPFPVGRPPITFPSVRALLREGRTDDPGSRAPAPRQRHPRPAAGSGAGSSQPKPPSPQPPAQPQPPRLADGIELLGAYQDSGYDQPPSLVRRPDGQVIQVSALLYEVVGQIDGVRGSAAIAEAVSR